MRAAAGIREDLAGLAASPGEARDLYFALLEVAHRMGRDPFIGEPVVGLLGVEKGTLDQVWRVRFDATGWQGEQRFVLHYLPPHLSRPTEVVWVSVEKVR